MSKFLFTFCILFFVCLAEIGQTTTLERGIYPQIEQESHPIFEEVYRLKIENKVGGTIDVSKDKGKSWVLIGKVLYPTEKINPNGYSASQWMGPGRVVAVAVNAIHIKVGAANESRTIFSILPKNFLKPPHMYRSYLSPDSSIYTDIPAAEGIFGAGYSPFVGNPVMLGSKGQTLLPITQDYRPKVGDTLYILVERPVNYPKEIIFENRFGGQITIKYFSGEEKVIGEVLRPVSGVGRFEGSIYADPGRIRANHAGVIDISASPLGSLGGFQIVPPLHAQEMTYVRKMTQWMVIGPPNVVDPSIEGEAPFFKYFIQPNYSAGDLESRNWWEKLLGHFLVEVKYAGKDKWRPMPIYALNRSFPLPSWADSVFDNISHFRILFPISGSGQSMVSQ
jgi:hypothetical protein